MPTPKPLDPLLALGDALLQAAPHNVLAKGGITISPVMGRQPTFYEEMNRPVQSVQSIPPSSKPSPAQTLKAATPLDLGDTILQFAPHNVLATLFGGGQTPTVPGRPPELPASVNSFADLPTKVDITMFRTGASGGVTYFANSMAVAVSGKNNHFDLKIPADRKFVTFLEVVDMKPTKVYEVGQFGMVKVGKDLPTIPKATLPVSVPDPPGGFGFIKKAEVSTVWANTEWKFVNYWGKGEDKKQTGSVGGVAIYTVTEYEDRRMLYLIPPIAPTQKDLDLRNQQMKEWDVRHPPAAPGALPESLDALRSKYLSEVDGWIGDAQSKISEMKFTDLAQANSVTSEITNAISSLSQANVSGQAPSFPLFTGGALPFITMFRGGGLIPLPPLPLPFPMARGGQAGNASSYVSSLNSTLTKANTVKAQMERNIQSAQNSLSNMQTYRSGIATSSDKQGIEYNHTQAKAEYDRITDNADSVHQGAADITSYRDTAKNSYQTGIAAITGQAAEGNAAAAQAAERARAMAEQERLMAESDANEKRMKAEQEAASARDAARQAASTEALKQRIVAEKEAAAAKAQAEQAAEEERVRQLREKYQKEQEERQAAEKAKLEARRQKLESVSAEAARLRQEAARKKLKQKK